MAHWPHITLSGLLVLTLPAIVLAAEDAGGHGGSGIQGDLAFWSLVTFAGFVIVVRKVGWHGFVDGLTERERLINEAIAEAEGKNRASQQELIERKGQLEAVDETTRGFIEEAHRDARRTQADIVASATSEAETLKRRALRDIERTRDQSLKGLFDVMTQRVIERTEERLRETLTASDQERLMDESLTQFVAGSPR